MFAVCGLTWWRKLEYPEKTTDIGRATTTLPHADTGDGTRVAAVTSEGFTPNFELWVFVLEIDLSRIFQVEISLYR